MASLDSPDKDCKLCILSQGEPGDILVDLGECPHRCAFCNGSGVELFLCEGCQTRSYCTESCQAADRERHASSCTQPQYLLEVKVPHRPGMISSCTLSVPRNASFRQLRTAIVSAFNSGGDDNAEFRISTVASSASSHSDWNHVQRPDTVCITDSVSREKVEEMEKRQEKIERPWTWYRSFHQGLKEVLDSEVYATKKLVYEDEGRVYEIEKWGIIPVADGEDRFRCLDLELTFVVERKQEIMMSIERSFQTLYSVELERRQRESSRSS